MENILIKVYAAFYPLPESLCPATLERELLALMAVPQPVDIPVAFREGDMARISFEGVYFPVDEALEIMERHFRQAELAAAGGIFCQADPEMHPPLLRIEGKLDVLDLEAWTLTRYLWKESRLCPASRSLDHVLAYSGH